MGNRPYAIIDAATEVNRQLDYCLERSVSRLCSKFVESVKSV